MSQLLQAIEHLRGAPWDKPSRPVSPILHNDSQDLQAQDTSGGKPAPETHLAFDPPIQLILERSREMGHEPKKQQHQLRLDAQITGWLGLLARSLHETKDVSSPLWDQLPFNPEKLRAKAHIRETPHTLKELEHPNQAFRQCLQDGERFMLLCLELPDLGRMPIEEFVLEAHTSTSSNSEASPLSPYLKAFRTWWVLRQNLRASLMVSNARLALANTRSASRAFPWEEQVLLGLTGLQRALKGFEPSRGGTLSTYAYNWTNQKIERTWQESSRALRIPVHRLDARRRILKIMATLSEEHNRPATPQELIACLKTEYPEKGWSKRKLNQLRRYFIPPATPGWHNYTGDRVLDCISDPTRGLPAQRLPLPPPLGLTRALREAVEESLAEIVKKKRDRDVIRRRFGLGLSSHETLEEIGAVYDVTRERIRQLEAKTLNKLTRRWQFDRPEVAIWLRTALHCEPLSADEND